MTTINEKQFTDKINRLNSSQQSIESLSGWCTFFRKDAKRVVRLWEVEFAKAPMDRQIAMLYLANDILQNSRRKGPEFINEFYHVMPRAISHLLKNGDAKVQQKVERLIKIWDERRVFGTSSTQSFKELATGAGNAETPKKAAGAAVPFTNGVQQHGAPASLQPLAEALSKADTAAQKSEAAVPPQAGSSVSELRRSQQQHNYYIAVLGAESVAHSSVIRLLRNMLSQQEAAEARTKAQMEECRSSMQRLTTQIAEAESLASPQAARPSHHEDEYSPTANMGSDNPWEAGAADAAAPPPTEEATGAEWPTPPQPTSPSFPAGGRASTGQTRRDPRAALGQQQQQQVPAPAPPPATHDGGLAEGDTAALAAQLAAGGDSALRLQQILANLPVEQQQAISAGLAGFAQPEQQAELVQDSGAGDDEYDPEDANMQLGF